MNNRFGWLLLLSQLALPTLAHAALTVPDAALGVVPAGIAAGWTDRRDDIDRRIEEIARRTAALDQSEAASARADLVGAKADAKSATGSSRASLDGAQSELAEARLVLDAANQELLVRVKELKVARANGSRSRVLTAKALVARAKGSVAVAEGDVSSFERQLTSVDRKGRDLRASAGRGVADARAALSDEAAPSPTRVQMEALLAKADEEAAHLELERAIFANSAGAGLELQLYRDALAAAELASVTAFGRLPASDLVGNCDLAGVLEGSDAAQ